MCRIAISNTLIKTLSFLKIIESFSGGQAFGYVFYMSKFYVFKRLGEVTIPEKDVNVLVLAHTRWASVGKNTLELAHPIKVHQLPAYIVHNGTILNSRVLRIANYYNKSDTWVIAKMVIPELYLRFGSWSKVVKYMSKKLPRQTIAIYTPEGIYVSNSLLSYNRLKIFEDIINSQYGENLPRTFHVALKNKKLVISEI